MILSKYDEKLIRDAGKSIPHLVTFLAEYLKWPIPPNMEPADVTPAEWSLEELRLDPDRFARIRKVSQLPKFTENQEIGVFVLEVDKGVLPIGALRRVVNRLVEKSRSNPAVQHEQWKMGDLVFFCQVDDENTSLHILHFQQVDSATVLRTIDWQKNSTMNRIELLSEKNLKHLMWPNVNDGSGAEKLRQSLGLAFSNGYREGIRSAAALARVMAETAKDVKVEVLNLYSVETNEGPVRELYQEIRERLSSSLTVEQFADMYAQTLVYGLLTARITHPEDFHASQTNFSLNFENPFLDSLYSKFRSASVGSSDQKFDLDQFGLLNLSQSLSNTDVDEILADFGTGEQREDPVVFFYEEFLQQYDKNQKKSLGTYYTPIPVVRFMVESVNHVLKDRCDIHEGLASSETWGDFSQRTGIAVPEGLVPSSSLVTVLDPATGTGTYVLEILRTAFRELENRKLSTPENKAKVVSAIDAFEISLSSYSVAELKVNLELDPKTRHLAKPQIRLTDSLEGNHLENLIGDDPLSVEGRAALNAKFQKHHSVVIGNPPYLRTKATGTGGWITDPLPTEPNLFSEIVAPKKLGAPIKFTYHSSVHNLYVYFWRLGFWKAFEQVQSGPGVVAFITASSWLTGPGFVGLRNLARELADEIFVIDLGGEGVGPAGQLDENIFPIQTSVSIVFLYRKNVSNRESPAQLHYIRKFGSALEKLSFLKTNSLLEIEFESGPSGWFDSFAPNSSNAQWDEFPSLADLMPWQQPGCKMGRTWPISPESETLKARWLTFTSAKGFEEKNRLFKPNSAGRGIQTSVGSLPKLLDLHASTEPLGIRAYAYRPFDYQRILADPRLAKTESPSLWSSQSDFQLYLVTSPNAEIATGPAAMIAAEVPDLHFFGSGGKDVLPLYRDKQGSPNFTSEILTKIESEIFEGKFAETLPIEMHLFAYIYGVLAGTDYTTRFQVELMNPGPRVPISLDKRLFFAMRDIGLKLIGAHTLGERTFGFTSELERPAFWTKTPTRIPRDTDEISYDPQTQVLSVADGQLSGVSARTWAFKVNRMPVLNKWLAYRTLKGAGKSVTSDSPLDRIRPDSWQENWTKEFPKIINGISESLELIEEGRLLLDQILELDTIKASDLLPVEGRLRKVPTSENWWEETNTLF
jgi:hypothetical protein